MKILGIQDGHSAAAALTDDGHVVAAVQEERLTRLKNQGGYPARAVQEVLDIAGWSPGALDGVAICGNGTTRMITRELVLAGYQRQFEQDARPLRGVGRRLRTSVRELSGGAGHDRRKAQRRQQRQDERARALVGLGVARERIRFVDHHLCHAATAFHGQGPQDHEVLVLTNDGAGDGLCATVRRGAPDGTLTLLESVPDDVSVGMLYSWLTYLLGFVPLEHEYKLMGMAPYAEDSPGARDLCTYFHRLYDIDGPRSLGWRRAAGAPSFEQLPPTLRDALTYKRFDHVAAGVQRFLEEFLLAWVERTVEVSGLRHLALAGGVFMNVKLNKRILELPAVESVYVFPSCSDESNAFGAAWALQAELQRERGEPVRIPRLGPVYLGRDFSDDDGRAAIAAYPFSKRYRVTPVDDIERRCAELLAAGQVVARAKGRMEFGARALGNRSILADPGSWSTIHTINSMIKKRDFWMPFAPSMLAEQAGRYLVNPKQAHAPYMIMAFDAQPAESTEIVAATHPYDQTCRPQVVEREWAPDYHRLISAYHELTGKGAVLNTSFNLHGFPVVNTPADALEVFDKSGLHHLALGNLHVEEVMGE